MIAANPGDGDSAIVIIIIVVVAAVIGRIIVVGCVTTLLRALQTIVILFGDVTARRRETISQVGASTTLVARRDRATTITRLLMKMVRLLSHLLQILEGTEDLLVKHVTLFARVIGRTYVRCASHHCHSIHLFAHLNHNLYDVIE